MEAIWDGRVILENFVYERMEDNLDTFWEKLLGSSGYNYESDGVVTFATEIEVFHRLEEDFKDVNLIHISWNIWMDERMH